MEDVFDFRGRLKYTWENQWKVGTRMMARLNIFYVLKDAGCQQGGYVGRYVIRGDYSFFIIIQFTFATFSVNPIVKGGNFLHECQIHEWPKCHCWYVQTMGWVESSCTFHF